MNLTPLDDVLDKHFGKVGTIDLGVAGKVALW